ncbi:DNA-binding anti-repressor SinI [Peribacillus loiseleuriae]|uniref:DNA-binding anti-repressor SinI n=1 Tax=Peribacillus loiseleuriae TaxID=1679170 RepID=UPI003D0167A0
MKLVEETQREEFDFEWVTLMLTAKQIGITPTEVRKFLQESQRMKIHHSLLKKSEATVE